VSARFAAAPAACCLLVLAGCGGGHEKHAVKPPAGHAKTTTATPPPYTGPWAVRVVKRTQLRTRPGGRVVATVGTRTEFHSKRYYAVARTAEAWVGVVTAERPNGHVAWVPEQNVELMHAPTSIRVDLSRRVLEVHRNGRIVMSFSVAVGAPGTDTPTGRFSVTDSLKTGPGSPYGCCILALSAHQPNIAQGWTGGDRVAIHGTPVTGSIGQAVSHGCLRATNANMRRLVRAITLGATVWIRA
jgi:lipoprotein-anchoring transpeptidase ErfK/SrfK